MRPTEDLWRAVAELASVQHGCAAHGQLIALALTDDRIQHALGTGRLMRIHRGVYELEGSARPLRREAAAILAVSPGATLTGIAVLTARGFAPRDEKRPVDVAVLGRGRRCHNQLGIQVHRYASLTPADIKIIDGLPMTTVERALLDAADEIGGLELAEAADEALSLHRTSRTKIREMARAAVGRRGREELLALAEARRPSTQTKGRLAKLALSLIREANLPEPETEVSMLGFSMDFFFREAGVVVEVDPFSIHGVIRANFNRDRRKARACREAGIELISVTGDDLTETPLAFISDLAPTIARRTEQRHVA